MIACNQSGTAAALGEEDLTWETGDTWVSAKPLLASRSVVGAQTPLGLAWVIGS